MFPTTQKIIELARGKPTALPTLTAEGESIGPWVTCRCGSSSRTPRCPTCEPVIHRVSL
jgi:hypothetical protein